MRRLLVPLLAMAVPSLAAADSSDGSLADLAFLIGAWDVQQTYSPYTDKSRQYVGTLVCRETLQGQYVLCQYEMQRPGKSAGLLDVYYNYNSIYGHFESLWVSSTWPVKVVMRGELTDDDAGPVLRSKAEFLIEGGATEFVKGELRTHSKDDVVQSFTRNTHIRTSDSQSEDWFHHMVEVVTRRPSN